MQHLKFSIESILAEPEPNIFAELPVLKCQESILADPEPNIFADMPMLERQDYIHVNENPEEMEMPILSPQIQIGYGHKPRRGGATKRGKRFSNQHVTKKRKLAPTNEHSTSETKEIQKVINDEEIVTQNEKDEEEIVTSYDHFDVISEKIKTNERFQMSQYVGRYMLKNLEDFYPGEHLQQVFDRALKALTDDVKKRGDTFDWVAFSINSPLLESSIGVNLHVINEETLQMLSNKFELVDMSRRSKGIDPLINEPFTVNITAIDKSKLKKYNHNGKGGKKKFPVIRPDINPNGLLNINNQDNLCLFRSILMLAIKKTKNRSNFYYYRFSHMAETDLQEMLDKIGVLPQDSYAIEDYGQKIQNFLDEKFKDQHFKIFAFEKFSGWKPFWESTVTYFKNPICVYFSDGHYDGIDIINLVLDTENYCFHCKKPYGMHHEHNCEMQCINCGHIIYGETPCQLQKDFKEFCYKCGKTFQNQICFKRHIKYNCNRHKYCNNCGRYYSTKNEPKHICGFTFCKKCNSRHNKDRGCNITKLAPPKNPPDYRIIIYDMETTQQRIDKSKKLEHKVNFISAYICCTFCVREGRWKTPLTADDDCPICGDYRQITFTTSEYHNTECPKKRICKKPTREFIDWLLHAYNQKSPQNQYENIVLAHNGTKFNLAEEIASYCINDSIILAHASIQLRELFMEATGVNIFLCNTIAAACMKYFRTEVLPDSNSLALITESGYGNDKWFSQSDLARKYIRWYAKQNDLEVVDSESPEGEKRIGRFRVDCWVPQQQPNGKTLPCNKVIEVHGCYYHACFICVKDEQKVMVGGKTAAKIREENRKREEELTRLGIEKNFEMEIKWECEIKKELKENPEMKQFFDSCKFAGAIRFREALYGGRTEVFGMHAETEEGYEIKYLDVNSLYPSRLYYKKFPTGHPDCKVINAECNITSQNELEEFAKRHNSKLNGLIKCLILPPRGSKIVPVLQSRFTQSGNFNLLFPFCRSCASESSERRVYKDNTDCYCKHHNWEDRAWNTTITRPEIDLALENGYIIKKLHRAYDFDKWDDQLFRNYVKNFNKIKIEASGWTKDCDFENKELASEEIQCNRGSFLKDITELYGIELDPEKIKANVGLRYISKLCLNNLWGRFALRNHLASTVFINDPGELFDLLDDHKIEIDDISQMNKHTLMVTSHPIDDFLEENSSSNLAISVFTTAYARIHLYEIIKKIVDAGGIILYVDTDSVIFKFKKSDGMPVETGKVLGTLTDEFPNHVILEVLGAGCKSYALKLLNLKTGQIEYLMKAKGITLDESTCKRLSYGRFREDVLRYYEHDDVTPINFKYSKIRNDKFGNVFTLETTKRWQPKITKGDVLPGGKVVPFGHFDPLNQKAKEHLNEFKNQNPNYNQQSNEFY